MRSTLLALDAHARGGRRAPWASALSVAVTCAVTALPLGPHGATARAFAAAGFDLTLVRPAQTSGTFLQQGDPRLQDVHVATVGLYQQLTLAPLKLREPITGQTENGLVSQRLETTLVGAWTPFRRVSVGASVAGVPWQGGAEPDVPLAGAASHPAHHAFGDVGLGAKVGLLPDPEGPGLHLAVGGDVFLPTGPASAYAGAGGWRAKTRLMAGYDGRAGALALGFGWDRIPRADVPLARILIDDLWTVGLAGAWRVREGLTAFAEIQASVLFETAQRLYPRGIRAALAEAPAYALLGARVAVASRYQAVFGAWKGLDAAPGAASLGLLAAVEARWDGHEEPRRQLGEPPTTSEEDDGEKAEADVPGSPPTQAAAVESEGDTDREKRPPDAGAESPRPSRPALRAESAARAEPGTPSLARREGNAIVLSEPLPWHGHTAKLSAASVPMLRAIAQLMKQDATPISTRLDLELEAVGPKPRDLALARRRATALQGVLAHLGRWAKKRITAKGVPDDGSTTDITRPALTLTFVAAGVERAEARPAVSRAEAEPATPSPAAPAPAQRPDATDDAAGTPLPPPSGALAWKDQDQILLARPLPWQGRTAKLAAASIPLLRALAATLKEEPASATLAVAVAPAGPGSAEIARAKARALALRGVLAHLAHWPARRITAAVGTSLSGSGDVREPDLSLRVTVGDSVHAKATSKRRGRH